MRRAPKCGLTEMRSSSKEMRSALRMVEGVNLRPPLVNLPPLANLPRAGAQSSRRATDPPPARSTRRPGIDVVATLECSAAALETNLRPRPWAAAALDFLPSPRQHSGARPPSPGPVVREDRPRLARVPRGGRVHLTAPVNQGGLPHDPLDPPMLAPPLDPVLCLVRGVLEARPSKVASEKRRHRLRRRSSDDAAEQAHHLKLLVAAACRLQRRVRAWRNRRRREAERLAREHVLEAEARECQRRHVLEEERRRNVELANIHACMGRLPPELRAPELFLDVQVRGALAEIYDSHVIWLEERAAEAKAKGGATSPATSPTTSPATSPRRLRRREPSPAAYAALRQAVRASVRASPARRAATGPTIGRGTKARTKATTKAGGTTPPASSSAMGADHTPATEEALHMSASPPPLPSAGPDPTEIHLELARWRRQAKENDPHASKLDLLAAAADVATASLAVVRSHAEKAQATAAARAARALKPASARVEAAREAADAARAKAIEASVRCGDVVNTPGPGWHHRRSEAVAIAQAADEVAEAAEVCLANALEHEESVRKVESEHLHAVRETEALKVAEATQAAVEAASEAQAEAEQRAARTSRLDAIVDAVKTKRR